MNPIDTKPEAARQMPRFARMVEEPMPAPAPPRQPVAHCTDPHCVICARGGQWA